MYPTLASSQTAYNSLIATPSLTAAFASFTAYYGTAVTERQWSTIDFSANSTLTPGTLSNQLEINNYLQYPLNNLTQYPKADYSFPNTYAQLTTPLSQIQIDFYTFVINALYFALPGLSTLKNDIFLN